MQADVIAVLAPEGASAIAARPADPVFPAIVPAFDAALMPPLLQQATSLPRIEACEIDEIIYAPRKRCIVSYRLTVREPGAAATRTQWCCVQARPHTAAGPLAAISEHGFELPALDAFGWVFPHDPALPGLPAMLDEATLRTLLPARLAIFAARPDLVLDRVEPQVVHYLPTRSCMIRYRLTVLDPRGGGRSELAMYGKVYAEHDGSAVYETMMQLSAPASGVRTAAPLGIDRELRAIWQSELPGRPADLRRTPADQLPAALESCARCLAAFHRSTPVLGRTFETAEILSRLRTTVKAVGASLPACAPPVRELVELLVQHAALADESLLVTPIHRDLKLANFLVEGGQAALIDLDGVRLGNPLSDLGSFISSLAAKALQIGWDAQRIDHAVAIFVDAYANEVPWPVCGLALDWHIAAALLYESTRRGLRQWHPGKLLAIPRYLELATRHATRLSAVAGGVHTSPSPI